MTDCMVFQNLGIATAALVHIDNLIKVPITGKRQKDSEEMPGKEKTERFAVPVERPDGKFFIEAIDPVRFPEYTQAEKQFIETQFPHTVEVFDRSWVPDVE